MKLFTILAIVLSVQLASVYGWNGDATYYNLGLTACGESFSNDDLVAAIGPNHWAGGNPNNDPICRRSATVWDGSRSVTVRIKDKCMGCKAGDIDLSPAAFQRLRPLSVGRFHVTWNFN